MIFALITLLTALFIAGTAATYSIIGLTSIFVGSTVAVLIMGTSLEVGKVVAISWLYRNWKIAPLLLKCYLIAGTFCLMLITSGGIFGYLTRAFIENEQPVAELQYELQALDTEMETLGLRKTALQDELLRLNADKGEARENYQDRKDALENSKKPVQDRINRLEGKIERLEKNKQELQSQLDAMYANYAEREARNIITKTAELRREEKPKRDALSAAIAEKDAEIGTVYDDIGRETEALERINAEIVASAPATEPAEDRIKEINEKLADFPNQEKELNLKRNRMETKIAGQKLEVGPLLYVAEIIYGEDNAESNLSSAVRWLVILLVLVFDPMAMALILAANISFAHVYRKGEKGHKLAGKLMEKQETELPLPADRPPEPLVHELAALRDELKTALDGMVRTPPPAVIDEDIDETADEPFAELPDEILDFADEAADDDRHDDHRFISDRQREHAADDPGRVLEALLEQRRRGDTRPRPAEPDADPEMMTQAQFDVLTQHMDAAETEQAYGRLSAAERNRITLWRSTGISKIKGKLGHAKKIHNEEQMRRVQESGADINNVEYLDDATEQ